MQYTKLGKSGLDVSRLCLGTMNFGPHTEQKEAFEIMSKAVDEGINFFDTADVYGAFEPGEGRGRSEEMIGNWLAEDQSRRGKIVLASKVFGAMTGGAFNDQGLSAYKIKRCCEDSLRRLQTDHIDIYMGHCIDLNTPREETIQAMEQLVREGKVTYLSSCNSTGWHIAAMNEEAKRSGIRSGLIGEQCGYSLLRRSFELEVIPAAREYGMGITAWAPLAGGLLSGVLAKEKLGRTASEKAQEQISALRPQLEQWEKLCSELGETPSNVAIAWLLHRPTKIIPITGPRTVEHLTSVLPSLKITLSEETLKQIDKIFPGPAAEAPNAYWQIPGISYKQQGSTK